MILFRWKMSVFHLNRNLEQMLICFFLLFHQSKILHKRFRKFHIVCFNIVKHLLMFVAETLTEKRIRKIALAYGIDNINIYCIFLLLKLGDVFDSIKI